MANDAAAVNGFSELIEDAAAKKADAEAVAATINIPAGDQAAPDAEVGGSADDIKAAIDEAYAAVLQCVDDIQHNQNSQKNKFDELAERQAALANLIAEHERNKQANAATAAAKAKKEQEQQRVTDEQAGVTQQIAHSTQEMTEVLEKLAKAYRQIDLLTRHREIGAAVDETITQPRLELERLAAAVEAAKVFLAGLNPVVDGPVQTIPQPGAEYTAVVGADAAALGAAAQGIAGAPFGGAALINNQFLQIFSTRQNSNPRYFETAMTAIPPSAVLQFAKNAANASAQMVADYLAASAQREKDRASAVEVASAQEAAEQKQLHVAALTASFAAIQTLVVSEFHTTTSDDLRTIKTNLDDLLKVLRSVLVDIENKLKNSQEDQQTIQANLARIAAELDQLNDALTKLVEDAANLAVVVPEYRRTIEHLEKEIADTDVQIQACYKTIQQNVRRMEQLKRALDRFADQETTRDKFKKQLISTVAKRQTTQGGGRQRGGARLARELGHEAAVLAGVETKLGEFQEEADAELEAALRRLAGDLDDAGYCIENSHPYVVVHEADKDVFERRVKTLIKRGYVPCGGPLFQKEYVQPLAAKTRTGLVAQMREEIETSAKQLILTDEIKPEDLDLPAYVFLETGVADLAAHVEAINAQCKTGDYAPFGGLLCYQKDEAWFVGQALLSTAGACAKEVLLASLATLGPRAEAGPARLADKAAAALVYNFLKHKYELPIAAGLAA